MAMKLTDERKKEIGLALFKYRLAKEGLHLQPNNMRREMGNVAKATGIPLPELLIFGKECVLELVEKTFAKE